MNANITPATGRRLAVIFGGPSTEHEVSLASAQSAMEQMRVLGWDVLGIGVGKDGRWHVGPDALTHLVQIADPTRLPLSIQRADAEATDFETFDGPPPMNVFKDVHLAFPIAHGQWGEDGKLQGLLHGYGLRFVGVDVTGSAVCFDKRLTKIVLTAAGVPVTPSHHVTMDDWTDHQQDVIHAIDETLGEGPWFVKPNRGGSSIGTVGPVQRDGLATAVEEALRYDDEVLVEQFIPHRELMVGVMHGDELVISSPLESIPRDGILDFDAKYRRSSIHFPVPDDVPAEQIAEIHRLTAAIVRALGCGNLCRVDFFLDTRSGQLLVNEVNTVPGLTAHSAFSQLMGTRGLSYASVLTQLCDHAEAEGR